MSVTDVFRTAACGCKWYLDGSRYVCLSHCDVSGEEDGKMAPQLDGAIVPSGSSSAETPYREILKANALRLADRHREECVGPTCNVSLGLLGDLLQEAGFKLTEEDVGRLM